MNIALLRIGFDRCVIIIANWFDDTDYTFTLKDSSYWVFVLFLAYLGFGRCSWYGENPDELQEAVSYRYRDWDQQSA